MAGTVAQSGKGRGKVRFGLFEADLRTGELFHHGTRVRLQEQPFQILAMLLENPGEVVTREELRNRLWPADTFVDFDHSLNAAIRRLRDALGDSAENPRFVATLARRGYRFLAPVERDGTPPSPVTTATPPLVGSGRSKWTLRLLAILGLVVVALGLGFYLTRPGPVPRTIAKRRLTANPTDVPVRLNGLSPDGRHLVFVDSTGFYVRNVETGETHSLILPGGFGLPDPNLDPFMTPGSAETPTASWLPDNEHFVLGWPIGSYASPSLWEVSALGGSPRKISDHGLQPAVSPDGTEIAFVVLNGSRAQLWLSASGENRRLLAYADGDILGTPAWSPDGKHLALAVASYDHDVIVRLNVRIDVVDVPTASARTILSQSGLGMCIGWTPDNRLIYSLQEPPPNQADASLWAISLNSTATQTRGSPVRLTDDSGSVASISLSRDGKRLAYSKLTIQSDVYLADVLANGSKLGFPRRITLDERQDYPWDWTRDSKSVIFTSDRNGTFNIFRQPIDHVEPELLVGGKDHLYIPRLNPDGSLLLYLATTPASTTAPVRLMRIPLAGGTPELVYQAKGILNFQCARLPASICILGINKDNTLQFFYFDPSKGIGSKLHISSPISNWSLAPDGRTLAIAKPLMGGSKTPILRLISLSDGHESDLPLTGWDVINAFDWAADGRSFWVSSSKAQISTLLNVDLKGRIHQVLSQRDMSIGWAIASPDGRHVALWKNSGTVNVWLLENY